MLLPATAPLQEQLASAPIPELKLDYLDGFPPRPTPGLTTIFTAAPGWSAPAAASTW